MWRSPRACRSFVQRAQYLAVVAHNFFGQRHLTLKIRVVRRQPIAAVQRLGQKNRINFFTFNRAIASFVRMSPPDAPNLVTLNDSTIEPHP